MKFHIVITDTETGKVVHEIDTNAIIGGCKTEEGSQGIVLASCGDFDLSIAINTAEKAIRSVKEKKGPVFALMTEMLPTLLKKEMEEKPIIDN